jgi:hypothetical protein
MTFSLRRERNRAGGTPQGARTGLGKGLNSGVNANSTCRASGVIGADVAFLKARNIPPIEVCLGKAREFGRAETRPTLAIPFYIKTGRRQRRPPQRAGLGNGSNPDTGNGGQLIFPHHFHRHQQGNASVTAGKRAMYFFIFCCVCMCVMIYTFHEASKIS